MAQNPSQPIMFPGFPADLPGIQPNFPGSSPGLPGFGGGFNNFILDELSSFPAVAYSVRLLTGSYGGACMNVRRDSDNTQKDIGFDIGGNLDVQTLLAFCGSGNGFVTKWYNQGSLGSSGDATQSTAANQPQIVASGAVETQNGVPAIRFLGGNVNLVAPKFANPSTNFSVSFVASVDSGSSNNTVVIDGGGFEVSGFYFQFNSNQVSAYFNNSSSSRGVYAGTASFSGVLVLAKCVYNSSGSTTAYVSGTLGYPVTGISWTLGSNANALLGNYPLTTYSQIGYQSEDIFWIGTNPSTADQITYDINAASAFNIPGVTQ